MIALFNAALALGSLVMTVPSGTFFGECLSGRRGLPKDDAGARRRTGSSVVVLVPAHDEAAGIEATLRNLMAQLDAGDEIVVVADNCRDDTAERARSAGATVLERQDPLRRGKGYALSHGIAWLAQREEPPNVVVVFDADCKISDGGLGALVAEAERTARPVQAEYVFLAPAEADVRTKIGVFALRVKNVIRPAGLHRFGFGRQLAGSGMAFPWPTLRDAPAMQGHITEDLVLGLELSLLGQTTRHCPAAQVTSVIAPSLAGQDGQRQRWEHGHLAACREYLPRLLRKALEQRSLELLVLACDLSVPPLAMLVISIGGTLAITLPLAVLAPHIGWLPATLGAINAALVGSGVAVAWWTQGRDLLSVHDLCVGVPRYLLWKLPSYARLLRRKRVTEWVRAER